MKKFENRCVLHFESINMNTTVNCFDQDFKSFEGHLPWGIRPFFFSKFKTRFGSWYFISHIYSGFYMFVLHTLSACWGRQRDHKKIH